VALAVAVFDEISGKRFTNKQIDKISKDIGKKTFF
jgi:hypothetical protein